MLGMGVSSYVLDERPFPQAGTGRKRTISAWHEGAAAGEARADV